MKHQPTEAEFDQITIPKSLLIELAEDLASEIDMRYSVNAEQYPHMRAKMLLDLDPVIRARKLLGATEIFSRAQTQEHTP